MKKFLTLVSMFMLCLHSMGSLIDAYQIYASCDYGGVGHDAELILNMKNKNAICSWTCTLVLPAGVTYKSIALADSRYPETYEANLTETPNADGSVTFTCEGNDGVALTGNDGAIAIVTVNIPDGFTPGDYTVTIKDTKLIDIYGSEYNRSSRETDWAITKNVMYLTGANGRRGQTMELTLNLKNFDEIAGWGCTIYLPEGVVFKQLSVVSERYSGSPYLTSESTSDGGTKFTCYGFDNLTGDDGAIATFTVSVPDNFELGNYNIELRDIALTSPEEVSCPVIRTSSFSWSTVDSFTITFDSNGGSTVENITQDNGTMITPPANPTREGYTFLGWEPALPETMPIGDLAVTAQWQINKYNLVYVLDGVEYSRSEVEYGATITPLATPTKTGHTFSGWSQVPATMPAHDVTITGSFTVNQYTITLNSNGGSTVESITQDYGSTITPPAIPTREGYTFLGWEPALPETMPIDGLTVTAQWVVNKYNLVYILDGVEFDRIEVEYGAAITLLTDPTKTGYTFSGWSELPETMPAQDVTVTGSFTINSYTLTYIVDNDVYRSSTVEYGTALTLEAEPMKEGYTFSGWSELPETMPAQDVTVTGSFTINSYTLTYIVDNDVYKSSTVEYGTALTLEAEPMKEGYTFSGWSELPETMPAQDVTVTGSFTINSYTLTYIVDNDVYKSSTVEYGTALTLEAEPMKEGYTFSGWSELPETMPAQDVTVTGSFTINSYTLTYIVDNDVYKSSTVEYGTALTLEAEPMKEGYTFSGWSELPETMPANNVTVTGSFAINQYTITFNSNGGSPVESITQDYSSQITVPANPTREGYTFLGWYPAIPEIMPLGGLTVQAQWSILTFTVAASASEGGNVMLSTANSGEIGTNVTAEWGSSVTITTAAEEGYELVSLIINNVNVTEQVSNNTYTILTVEEDMTIEATFALIPETDTDISLLANAIYIEPFSARIGDNVQMEICLKNAEAATAYVFDLVLPDGITVAKNDKGRYIDELSDRHDDHSRTFNDKGYNTYALSALSGNSEELVGNDGAIRILTLHVDESVAEGVYPILIRNASYSKPDGTLVALPNTRTSVIAEDYMLGDVNGNGGIDIGDAVSIVNYLVGKESSNFIEKAADTNLNGLVDIGDAVTIVNFLVGKTTSLSLQRPAKVLDEKEPQ